MTGKTALVLLTAVICFACSTVDKSSLLPWEKGQATKITDIRPADQNATPITIRIPLKNYARALAEGGNLNTARLVEIYASAKSMENPPEYRVFDVQKGGVFDLLHLGDADIIVSAHGYVIPNQDIFFAYLNKMKDLKGGFIEVIRSGRTFNITYILTE